MRVPLLAMLILLTALGGCAGIRQSRLNPFNWFGQSRPAPVTELYAAPTDERPLVAQVLTLKIEPYPGGAIVRATGLPPTQGYWEAELVPQPVDEDGRLLYEFRIFPPITPAAAGTPFSRQVVVAASISDIRLQGVNSIAVQGESNALSARR
jgi:hypothetical protein